MQIKAAATQLILRRGGKRPQRVKIPDLQALPMLTGFCCGPPHHFKKQMLMLPHCLEWNLHWCSCLAARTLSWRNKRRMMSTCSTAACPRKIGRNSTAAASSSWDHLCYKKAKKMKCQLCLSECITVPFIYHPTASDLQSNQFELQILPLHLLFHKGVKNTAFTAGLLLATTKCLSRRSNKPNQFTFKEKWWNSWCTP